MDFSPVIEEYGIEKVCATIAKLFDVKRVGKGLVNLLLDMINEKFFHFDSNRSPCGFEKEDCELVLKIIPLLQN
nr:p8 [Sweet potato chlorotic stunt virus]